MALVPNIVLKIESVITHTQKHMHTMIYEAQQNCLRPWVKALLCLEEVLPRWRLLDFASNKEFKAKSNELERGKGEGDGGERVCGGPRGKEERGGGGPRAREEES